MDKLNRGSKNCLTGPGDIFFILTSFDLIKIKTFLWFKLVCHFFIHRR